MPHGGSSLHGALDDSTDIHTPLEPTLDKDQQIAFNLV